MQDNLNQYVQKQLKSTNLFTKVGLKSGGIYGGYIASRQGKKSETEKLYLVKYFCHKINDNICLFFDYEPSFREFLAGGFYSYLLGTQTAAIKLIKSNEESFSITSKFINNVKQLKLFLNDNFDQLNQIKGFEKVFAALSILGEGDFKSDNLLVRSTNNYHQIVKIDHGYTFKLFNKNFDDFVKAHKSRFMQYTYTDFIRYGMNFNIDVLVKNLDEMLTKLDANTVDKLFDDRLNFLFESMSILKSKKSEEYFADIKTCLQSNIKFMRNIVLPNFKIIMRFSNMSQEFKNGLWFLELSDSENKDPILFAKLNSIEIKDTALEDKIDSGRAK